MSDEKSPHALVVGAGIGGLATAAGLARIGWRVTVFERSADLRTSGAAISLLANATRSLDELGAGPAVAAASATMMPGGEGVRVPSGRRLMKRTDPDFVREHGLSTIILSRAELHRALRELLPADCFRLGAKVTGVLNLPDGGAVLSYTDEQGDHTASADLVVGADGMNSGLRSELFPATAAPVYSGHSVFRGIAEVSMPAEQGGTTWGRSSEIGRMPLADGRVYWYAVVNATPGLRHTDPRAEVLRRFGRWHAPIPELLAATPTDTILYHDVYELADHLPSYVVDSTALLGDAAHAMTSDLGQGACQAIEDAVVLAAALADAPTIAEGLAEYDRQRRPRSQSVVDASRRIGRMKLRDRRWEILVRNLMMRVTPPRAGERSMAVIGDWHPPALAKRVST
ncbi:MAG TPA: FAD-dependent monooxygenase [Pseudonocardiaceae bacterium]